jgi:hypothetical protein
VERFELEHKLKEEIRSRVLGDGFMKIVQSVRRNGKQFKIAMRPVEIGGEKKFQAEMTDDKFVQVKNLSINQAAEGLEEIIAQRGARDLHLMTAKGDLHIRVTRKGKVTVSRSAEMDRVVTVQPHDRVKKLPLTSFDAEPFLSAAGITDGEGRIKASMRGKYDQVNEFLKVVKEALSSWKAQDDKPFVLVDCGCGKAYLTIAAYLFLTRSLGIKNVRVIGIDRRDDVVSSARKIAKNLDIDGDVAFIEADIATVSEKELGVPRADMVVSLHACDTATDEALAKAVEWKARFILCAPCCQHELQKTLADKGAFAGLMRQSILRERLCDILTDSFRAMILRILGFKTNVVEFVSSEATARNIMIKCEYGAKPGQSGPVSEYLNLRDYWKVTPWLESRLEGLLSKYFARFD